MDDITIDRLVLNIPGLTVDDSKEVSDRVGKGLADAATKDSGPKENNFGTLTVDLNVDLNDQAASRNLPRLADMIVESILRQIG